MLQDGNSVSSRQITHRQNRYLLSVSLATEKESRKPNLREPTKQLCEILRLHEEASDEWREKTNPKNRGR